MTRRQYIEQLLQQAYLRQEVYHHADAIKVYWPDDLTLSGEITVRLQTPAGRIYAEAHPSVQAGTVVSLGSVYQVPDGAYQVMLMPNLEEYYVHKVHVERPLPVQITNAPYAITPYGTVPERRLEALADAAQRNLNLFSEIARLELGRGATVDWTVVEAAAAPRNGGAHGCTVAVIGLLGLLARYQDDASLPENRKAHLIDCLLAFPFALDESAGKYAAESDQILCYTGEMLVGQLFPAAIFPHTGQTGAWHQANGEQLALAWLRKRAATGFRDWDSGFPFEAMIVALTHLVDLAENEEVAEMAAVLLDKLFFSMAVNSYQGVLGATQGCADAVSIKNGRLAPVSGIARLLWGVGSFNEQIAGTVSLACAHGYELPSIIAEIAADLPDELWSRERHAASEAANADSTGAWEVNKMIYKTPDYLLGSTQDYQPGALGAQEQIWQAILGPDAVVFVNHPASCGVDNAPSLAFWCGNRVLPRVAQWQDMLIAIHKLPADDPLGFTHAYFPTTAFDEYLLRDGWAFARKGNGYCALTAAHGVTLTTTGASAYRELRSVGQANIWLCQLGRAALDGSFSDFQTRVLALPVRFDGLVVQITTLREETIAFGWTEPLLVNGQAVPLRYLYHYDNPYCVADLPAANMAIQFQDQQMQLVFAEPA